MNKLPLMLLLMAGILPACQKTDEAIELTGKKWRPQTLQLRNPATDGDAQTRAFRDCEQDDYLLFKDNGVLTIGKGAVKCHAGETDGSGHWQYDPARQILTTTELGNPDERSAWTIVSLSRQTLVLKSQSLVFGDSLDITLTLAAE